MKKVLFALVLLLSVALAGCADGRNAGLADKVLQQSHEGELEQEVVTSLVENFGKKLQLVSPLAPEQTFRESMQENYADFVSPSLLEKWKSDPQNAPGRNVSSPWPDRIEVLTVEKNGDDAYRVKGKIVEITSVEQQNDKAAAKRAVIFDVRKIGDRWLIDAAEFGAYEDEREDAIVYENAEYGFRFDLPSSWKGYTIVNDKWEGLSFDESQNGEVVAGGPIISIRHPQWTAENPRQDIPIMVFTLDEWNSLEQEKFHIGAAPVGPTELGRNNGHVFALPARYNFAFPTGYEEVEDILKNNPLQPMEQ